MMFGIRCVCGSAPSPTFECGAVVVDFEPLSPAAQAGLHRGDIITEINQYRVSNADEAAKVSALVKEAYVLLRVQNGSGSRYVVLATRPRKILKPRLNL